MNTFASVAFTALQSAPSGTNVILSPLCMPLPCSVTRRTAPTNTFFTLFTASMPITFMLKLYTGVHASSTLSKRHRPYAPTFGMFTRPVRVHSLIVYS